MARLEFIIGEKLNPETKQGKESYKQSIILSYDGHTVLNIEKCVNYKENGIYGTLFLKDTSYLEDNLLKFVDDVSKNYSCSNSLKCALIFGTLTINIHPVNFSKLKYFEQITPPPDSFRWDSDFFRATYTPKEDTVFFLTNFNISRQLANLISGNYKFSTKDRRHVHKTINEVLSYLH